MNALGGNITVNTHVPSLNDKMEVFFMLTVTIDSLLSGRTLTMPCNAAIL